MKKISVIVLTATLFNIKIMFAQDSIFVYPSAAEVDEKVNCKVIKEENSLKFVYLINNSVESKQSIQRFMIDIFTELWNIESPVGWNGKKLTIKNVVSWSTYDSSNYILPSGQLDNFNYRSNYILGISHYYIHGYIKIPYFEFGEVPEKIVNDDIFENSKQGLTIGPKDLPNPFVISEFIDTISYYISRSFELGWIKDEQTRDKYISYINNVKEKEEIGDSEEARNILDKIMNEAETDSLEKITSEAFALIYYNAEYLKSQISGVLSVPR